MDDQQNVVPVWTLVTQDVRTPLFPGVEEMTPQLLGHLRSVLADMANAPIATLEAHPVPAELDRRGGIHLERNSPLAPHLSQLINQTPNLPKRVASEAVGGEVLYRMVVPAKIADKVSKGVVKPMASTAAAGGVHGALTKSSRIVGQATYVPVAGKAGAAGAAGGAAAAGAGTLTMAAPLVLMAVAVGVSAYADQKRQAAMDRVTELLEAMASDKLQKERTDLNGCRDAIEKATALLLDQGTIGLTLGLDSAVDTINKAFAMAEDRLAGWRRKLEGLGVGAVELNTLLKAFPDIGEPVSEFRAHLELAAVANNLKRRVLVLQAVQHAQMDKDNPFESFTRTLQQDEKRLIELESGIVDVLRRLSEIRVIRSKRFLDKHLLTASEADTLLNTAYKLRELGHQTPGESPTDVEIDIAREQDGSVIVFPVRPVA